MKLHTKIFYSTIFLLLFVGYYSYAQTTIVGTITDEKLELVDNVAIVLIDEIQSKTLGYTFSNIKGVYRLATPISEGIYKLEFSKIGYKKTVQEIVIGTDEASELVVDINLKTHAFELGEVLIKANNPIIVKKDTILYDIDRLRSKHDESLEDVLVNIEGFKILPSGDIEINGKLIRKVLIDGKETSDFGSAMLVKSLGADKIENIEVRFDEKDAKIKESLLDNEKFVVLDISLKKDFNQQLFGKQQIRIGHGDNTKIGGLTNLFSLNKNINLQFFAELDHFGRNEIELKHIRNIGAEAFNRMFDTPVDIDDIKARSGYQEEIYGFDNFVSNDKAIVGLSVNLPLSNKTDFYIGSFSDYRFIQNQYARDLYFDNQLLSFYQEENQNRAFNSKNKIQLKHTSDKLKINSDANFVYAKQRIWNQITETAETDFKKNHQAKDRYFNNKIEYLFSDSFGVSETLSFSREQYDIEPWLTTENSEILDYFNLSFGDAFYQLHTTKETVLNNIIEFTYLGKSLGNHSLGYQYTKNNLENEKHSNISDFTASFYKYYSDSHTLFYIGSLLLGPVYTQVTLKNAFIDFPFETQRKRESYFQYDAKITYDVGLQTNLSLASSRLVSLYPLQKTVEGKLLTDFQTVFVPSQQINPYYNTNYSAVFNKVFHRRGELTLAYVYGESENLDAQYFQNDMIINQAEQLSNQIHLISTQFERRFPSINFSAKLEPELILSTSEFLNESTIENSKAYQYLLGLKLGYKLNDYFHFNYYPKYSYFVFDNSLKTSANRYFDFLTNYFSVNSYLFESALKLGLNYKQVNFLKTHSDFNNFNFKAVYKTEKHRYFIELNNLLNSRSFITEDLNHTLLNVNTNRVFGRFINFGFEVRIN